jgi:hypothetical protein
MSASPGHNVADATRSTPVRNSSSRRERFLRADERAHETAVESGHRLVWQTRIGQEAFRVFRAVDPRRFDIDLFESSTP